MEITAEKIMQQLSAGTQVAGVIAVFGEEGYYKDKSSRIYDLVCFSRGFSIYICLALS